MAAKSASGIQTGQIGQSDRVGALLGAIRHKRRIIISPEGVPLEVQVASHGERLGAFAIDICFMLLAVILLYLLLWALFFSGSNLSVGMTIILFAAFVVRNFYFVHFELAWQGRTPGKRLCKLRVINRNGGELAPSAIIARNLTREVEFFLPVSLFFSLPGGGWQAWCMLGWALALAAVPFVNRYHLRLGDLIGGTQVIAMPRQVLLADLSMEGHRQSAAPVRAGQAGQAEPAAPGGQAGQAGRTGQTDPADQAGRQAALASGQAGQNGQSGQIGQTQKPGQRPEAPLFSFSHEQLARYGAFELQVLEEFLRRPDSVQTQRLLQEVCQKICRKINWEGGEIPPRQVRRFLTDFYTAERADLERGQLFGKLREDKNAAAQASQTAQAAKMGDLSPPDKK